MTSARHDQFLITGTFNFRDVGGARTAAGARIRDGVLLRSAQLSRLDDEGRDQLLALGVTDVHDLRGHAEIDFIGHDALPDQVRLHVTPFDSRMGMTPPHEARMAATAANHMLEVYRMFPAMPEAHAAINKLAESALAGTALVHCAAGKDRTGWAVATLLRTVGVTEEEVYADYLRSNDAVPHLRALMTADSDEELSDDLLGVKPAYLDELGITSDTRDALRARLVE